MQRRYRRLILSKCAKADESFEILDIPRFFDMAARRSNLALMTLILDHYSHIANPIEKLNVAEVLGDAVWNGRHDAIE